MVDNADAQDIAQEALAYRRDLLDEAESLCHHGQGSRADVLEAEANYADAKRAVEALATSERTELVEALLGIWDYACTGASLSDVNTYEQPQFVAARRALFRHGKLDHAAMNDRQAKGAA